MGHDGGGAPGTFEGKFRIDLPSKQYMMLRLTKLEA